MLKRYLKKVLFALNDSKKVLIAFGTIVVLLIVITLISYTFLKNGSTTNDEDYYKVFSVRIPKTLFFADEQVPTENEETRKSLAREIIKNTNWKKQSFILHQLSSQWFPVIEPILKKNGIPEDFKYIALVESQLTNVTSEKGAVGFWQIIESTGKNYGLEITEDIDERYNIVKSTEAACKYFKEAYQQLNNWTLVAASYNMGITGIQTQVTNQKNNNYYQLKLVKETGSYVYKILAMKELICNPKVYGITIRKKGVKINYATKKITVDSSIYDLEAFSKEKGIDLKILKLFNPWLRSNRLIDTSKKKYIIELPKNNGIKGNTKTNNKVLDTIYDEEISTSRDSTSQKN